MGDAGDGGVQQKRPSGDGFLGLVEEEKMSGLGRLDLAVMIYLVFFCGSKRQDDARAFLFVKEKKKLACGDGSWWKKV
jgi:hypothetical protein